MRRVHKTVAGSLMLLALGTSCDVPPQEDGVEVTGQASVITNFADGTVASTGANSTTMAFAPDGRLFVCRQDGTLRLMKGSTVSTWVTISNVDTQGERGLLGVALDPDWANNKWVYLYYTNVDARDSTGAVTKAHNRVIRIKASSTNTDVADTSTRQTLLDLPALTAIYHNGGALAFGHDGKLYIAVGDNKTNAPARQTNSYFGKILRINKDGTRATDNPWYNGANGPEDRIWQKGLRNPYTFAFDPVNGRMFINDVGENIWEEINDGKKGLDYGWPTLSGAGDATQGITGPFYTYDHTTQVSGKASCAIIGATFYNPPTSKYPSDYIGKYFFADYCNSTIRRIDPASTSSSRGIASFASGITSPVDVRVSPSDGNVYYLKRNGEVHKITYTGTAAPYITEQPVSQTAGAGQNVTFSVTAGGGGTLSYQWYKVDTAGTTTTISGATAASYTHAALSSENGYKYKCKVTNSVGSATSNTATLTVVTDKPPVAKITAPVVGATYIGGQTIMYAGTGTDPEDGTEPAANFTWQIDFHHDTHTHPILLPTSGMTSGQFTVSTNNEVSDNVYIEIKLTVKDSKGLTSTTSVNVMPVKQTFTVASNPTGLQLTLDGTPFTAPKTVTGVVGITRQLGVVSPQTLNGVNYVFSSWSDGGAASHNISTPSTATTYTATFKQGTTKIYEAENATIVGGIVASSSAGYTGTGFVDYQNASGDYVEFTVNAAAAGSFPLAFRYALGATTTRSLSISVNGKVVNSALAFTPTGAWTTWNTVSVPSAALVAGTNKVRATATGTSGPNLDHLEAP